MCNLISLFISDLVAGVQCCAGRRVAAADSQRPAHRIPNQVRGQDQAGVPHCARRRSRGAHFSARNSAGYFQEISARRLHKLVWITR